jgi:hypothetical protein
MVVAGYLTTGRNEILSMVSWVTNPEIPAVVVESRTVAAVLVVSVDIVVVVASVTFPTTKSLFIPSKGVRSQFFFEITRRPLPGLI